MQAAIFTSIFVSLLIAFGLALWAEHGRAAQDEARERRMAEHRLQAKLLILNL